MSQRRVDGGPEDTVHMRRALELAERGRGRVEPNPMVGAVIVDGGEVVGEGWHGEYGGPHAEAVALRAAGERARGATVYVTLEPCAHHGKTPPCADALIAAGVARVVYACADPNPKARGGAAVLRDAGIVTVGGIEGREALDLNARFFHSVSAIGAQRPWIELKLALSLDARVADASGRASWITGDPARAVVHRIRAGHDAIAVGIETALADDPLLTVRGDVLPRRAPVRVVFDRGLRLPLHSRLVASRDEAAVWVVCSPDAPASRRAQMEGAGVRVVAAADLPHAVLALREGGIESLLVEGGGRLGSALLNENLVDRMTLFYAPVLLGPAGRGGFAAVADVALPDAARWRLVRSASVGEDVMVVLAR